MEQRGKEWFFSPGLLSKKEENSILFFLPFFFLRFLPAKKKSKNEGADSFTSKKTKKILCKMYM